MPTDEEYQRLARFRRRLREFDSWSRAEAERQGLTHTQHQLLLAIRGSETAAGPTIGEVADALQVRHHTATELVDRTQALGYVARVPDADDHRRVRLALTDAGNEVLHQLTNVHLGELRRLAPLLDGL